MFCFEEAKSYYLQAYSQTDIFTKQDSWIILATLGFIIICHFENRTLLLKQCQYIVRNNKI